MIIIHQQREINLFEPTNFGSTTLEVKKNSDEGKVLRLLHKTLLFRQRLLLSLSLHICSSYKQKKTQQKLINLISSKVNKRNNSTDLLTYLLGSRKIFRSSLNCYLLLVLDSILTTSIVTFTGSLISVQLSSAPPKSNRFELWWRPPVDWGRVHEHWRPHNSHHGWNEDLKNTLSDVGTHLNNLS